MDTLGTSGEDDWLRKKIASSGNERMPSDVKAGLWDRIARSTGKKRSRFFPAYPLAAALILALLSAGAWYLYSGSHNSRLMYRLAAGTSLESKYTEILLSDNRSVVLDSADAEISYGRNNGQISINSKKGYDQVLSQEQTAYNTLTVPYGQRATLLLSDGTRVWVNSGSKLVYPVVFAKDKREVYLDGEGYFEVARNQEAPMTIYTRDMEVNVLGTEFNLCAYPDDARSYTVLASGSIELTTGVGSLFGRKKHRIAPGQKAELEVSGKQLRIDKVEVGDYISWKDGFLVLRSAPLKDIVKRLSRYYRVGISLEDDALHAGQTLSGNLLLQDDIRNTIEILCSTSRLAYDEKKEGIILREGNE